MFRLTPKSSRLLVLVIVLVLWGLITHGTYAGTGDEPHYQMMAHSLAFDGDLDLTNDYTDESNLALGSLNAGPHVHPGKDGRMRPVHDVGLPILFTPYYALAYTITERIVEYVPESWLRGARLNFRVILRHWLSLAMIGITAWLGVRLFDAFMEIQPHNPTRAFAWAALLVFSPPLLSHSFLFFTEIVSAFLAFLVFRWLRTASTSRLMALLAGSVTGYLFLVHARNIGLIAGLIVMAMYRSRRWTNGPTRLGYFLSGAATLLLVRAFVTFHFWGTWLTTPHARLDAAAPLVAESLTRLSGWLFDQEHGLLPYAPIYLLLPVGWAMLWKRDRELCLEISLVLGAYVSVMTLPLLNVHGWRGGWSPAARFLVPVAPLLGILVFSAVGYVRRLPTVVIGLIVLQVCLDAVFWQQPKVFWNDGNGTSAFLRYLDSGTGRLSSYFPSLVTPINFTTIAIITGIIIVWLFMTVWLLRSLASSTAHGSARWSPPDS